MIDLHSRTYIFSTALVVSILGLVAYKKFKKEHLPKTWKPVGKISDLYLYPLKSGRRVSVSDAECTRYGMRQISDKAVHQLRDRNFIVYDENSKQYVSGSRKHQLVLVKVSNYDTNHVALDAEGMRTLYIEIPKNRPERIIKCRMYGAESGVETIDCGDEAAIWISRYLSQSTSGLRLGYYDESLKARIFQDKAKDFYPKMKNEDMGMFSYVSGFMLINQSSVDDLNTRLEHKVPSYQFRPSIVVKDAVPYEENIWKWIKIGEDAIFENVMPCTRCTFVNVDADLGVASDKQEPLKTLRTQLSDLKERKASNNSPVLGAYMALRKPGKIHLDDIVYVNE